MTEKRFQWVFIKDNELELRDNGIVKRFNNERLEELLNELHEENELLRQDNQKMRIQRHEDINYLAKIAMEYKAINTIFKKALKEAKHSIEYDTIVKMGKNIGVEFND